MIRGLKYAGMAGLTALFTSEAALAGPLEGAEYDLDIEFESTVALSPFSDDAGPIDLSEALYAIKFDAEAEALLESGTAFGVRLRVEAQRDNPARAGFSGRLGDGLVDEPLAPRGAFTGLTLGGPIEDIGDQVSISRVALFVKGGYGELLVGRDQGVASRFFRGAPDVFSHARLSDARLDAAGIATIRTRNDLTGPAFKLTYTTPRLLGVRAGVSITPDADARGLDRDPARSVEGVEPLSLENAVEVAANVSRRLRKSGVRLRGHLSFSRAGVDSGLDFERSSDVNTGSVGGSAEFKHVTFGGSVLVSNNGGDGRYLAWTVGAGGELFGFDWSANYGQADDNLLGIEGRAWSLGAARSFKEKVGVAFGLQSQILDLDQATEFSLGPVVEITLSF